VETADGDTVYTAYLSWAQSQSAAIDHGGRFEIQTRRSAGGCLVFDGADDHVVFASTIDLASSIGFTIECYAKWDGGTGDRGIWTNGQLSLYKRAADDKVVASLVLAGGTITAVSSAALAADTWTHIAATWDAAAHVLTLLIDGDSVATKSVFSETDLAAESGDLFETESDDPLVTETLDTSLATPITPQLGRGLDAVADIAYWDGSLDELRIWKSLVRDADDIAAGLEDALTGREDHLAGYWPMDESLSTLIDATPNGNTGTITGATFGVGALGSQWSPSFFVDGGQRSVELPPLKAGQSYDMEMRSVNALGVRSAWSSLSGFVVGSSGGATEQDDWGAVTDDPGSSEDWGAVTDDPDDSEDWGSII
jgi:hypothetical protein